MKVNEVIRESWYDTIAQARSAIKQAGAETPAKNNYSQLIDRFQKELEKTSPEDSKELDNLRKNYKLNPSYKNAIELTRFITDRTSYVKDKQLAQAAMGATLQAANQLKQGNQTAPATPPGPDPSTVPAYLRKGMKPPTTSNVPTVTTPSIATTTAAPAGTKSPTVINVGGEDIYKSDDGNWYDEEGAKIVNPNDIKELERRLAAKTHPASAGAYVPSATFKPSTTAMQRTNRSKKRRRK